MKITSEQEMLNFGESFSARVTGVEGLPRSSRQGGCRGRENTRQDPCSTQSETEPWRQDPSSTRIIELVGDVGAGKTTFTRGLAKGLGIKAPVTSPSFTISKSYACPDGRTLTHYDFYRLSDPGIMIDDLLENIKNGHIIIVEWGNSVQDILPENRTIINFIKNDDGSRELIISSPGRVTTFQGTLGASGFGGKKGRQDPSSTLYLDTSTNTTVLKLNGKTYEWESGHALAEQLLQFIYDKLQENHKTWQDIESITFMSGPGSFTGLRIGAAVVNTLSHELNIPLYDENGTKHQIILPNYGRPANITATKK